MIVQSITPFRYNRTNYSDKNITPAFKGHSGIETTYKLGKKVVLTTETAFFREPETLRFAKEYTDETFENSPIKRIIVGACSSGEEAWSYKMLFNDTPVKIYAFDPALRLICSAKKGIVEISQPKNEMAHNFIKEFKVDGYKDSFLAFPKENLTKEETKILKKFNNTFEFVPPATSFILGVSHYKKLYPNGPFVEFEKKFFKLKNPEQDNCDFFVADIKNFKQARPQMLKSHIFSFRNALYHLTTKKISDTRIELPKETIVNTMDTILKNINRSLEKQGLLVFGERENHQGTNMRMITDMLPCYGFKPIPNNISASYHHIWAKTKEI